MLPWKTCTICGLRAPDVVDVNGECRCPTADRCRRVLHGLPLSDEPWRGEPSSPKLLPQEGNGAHPGVLAVEPPN